MKRVIYIFFILIGVLIDQVSKYWARISDKSMSNYLFSISYNKNFAFAFESMDFVSHEYLTLFAGLLYCFIGIIISFLIFFVLKNNKYNIPNWGLCFLLVGITGNSIDKIFNGFVTDFIVFKLSFLDEIILNIADIYLIIGVIWLTIITLFYSAIIWYEGNKRNILLIDKNFQRDYSIRLASITIIGMFFSTMLTFLILRFQEVQITVKISLLLLVFQIGFLCFLSLTIYFFGIIESHKSCGAIFAFKKYIEGPMDNSFKLRENDAHKEILAECANLIRKNKLKNND